MLSVLYIDDEPALLDIAKVFLEKTGDFTVVTSESAPAALQYLGSNPVDAVVADYQMPGMNGIELLITVRERYGDVPFILFTGRGREEVVIQAINNGADFYLQKGGDPKAQFAELVHKIKKAVENRQALDALRDSEQRLADIIDFLPDATFAVDRAGRVIAWNHAIEEMTGIPAADMLGKGEYEYAVPFYGTRRPTLIDLVHETDEAVAKLYSHIVRQKDVLIADTTLPLLKGRPVTLMVKASPLYNREGKIAGAIESIRDITYLKTTEEDLLRAKKDWETIFRAIGHPVIVLDAKNRIIDANDATLRITGKPLDELKGKHCYEVFHTPGTDRPPESCPFEQMKKSGNAESTEVDLETLNGSYHVSCTPVFDDAGQLEKVIHIAMDVTERRQEQDELAAMYGQLAASEDDLRRQLDEIDKAQQERERTEKNFRALVDNAPDAIFIQANDRFVYLNNSALRLFGASTADQLLGKDPWDRIDPSFHEVVKKRVRDLTVDGKSVGKLDEVYLKLDGTPVDVEVTAVPFQFEGEHGALVMLHDITARKRSETELHVAYEQLTASQELLRRQYGELAQNQQRIRESEEKYRGIFENTTVAIFRTRPDGSVETANPAFARILGYESAEEAIEGIPDMRKIYVSPEMRDKVWRKLASHGAIKDFELALRRKDGSSIWVLANVRVNRDSEGKIIGADGMAVDISDRKNAEESLRESEEKFRALVETTSDFIWEVDERGRYTYVSPKVRDLLGYEPAELIGKTPFDLMPEEEAERVGADFQRCVASQLPISALENRNLKKDGSTIILETSGVPRFDTRGRFAGYRGIDRDITDRRHMESAFQALVKGMVGTTGIDALDRITESVASWLQADCVIIGEILPDGGRVNVLSMLLDGERVTGFIYNLPGTPCGNTAEKGFCIYPDNVRQIFPQAKDLAELSIRGYVGTPLQNAECRTIGVLCIMSRKPIRPDPGIRTIMEIIAVKASAEIERKRVEEALVDEMTKRKILIDQSRDGFVTLDSDGRVYEANRRFAEMLGYTPEEMRELHVWDWDTRIEREQLLEMIRKIDAAGDHFETRHKRKDGTVLDVEISTNAATFSGKKLIFCVVRDITGRKRMEDALRESEEWSRTILNAAQAGIILVDATTHRIIDANPKALHLIGAPRDAVIGSVCHRFICPAERGKCPVTDLGQNVDTSERILLTAAGTTIPVLKTVVPVHISGRNMLVESFIDISEQKHSEAAVREVNRKLNLLNSITRHDVANQLTVLRGYTELAQFTKPEPVIAGFLAKIADSAELIQRQIDFTRAYQELGMYAPAWQQVGEVIRKVRPGIITVTVTCDNYEIFADQLLERVFFNLFDNAVRHGEHVTAITVQCVIADQELVITVEDNGIGIPLDAKQKIFDRGFGRNTGFGLFLAREILAITGIGIYETGVHGKGARFEIRVPEGAYRIR